MPTVLTHAKAVHMMRPQCLECEDVRGVRRGPFTLRI